MFTSCECNDNIYFDICDDVICEIETDENNFPLLIDYSVNGVSNNIIIYDTSNVIIRCGCIGDFIHLSINNATNQNVYDINKYLINVRIFYHNKILIDTCDYKLFNIITELKFIYN